LVSIGGRTLQQASILIKADGGGKYAKEAIFLRATMRRRLWQGGAPRSTRTRSSRWPVHPEWLQAAMNSCQAMAGLPPSNVGALLEAIRSMATRIPVPSTPLEAVILRGLIAEVMVRHLASQGTIPSDCVRVLADSAKVAMRGPSGGAARCGHPKVLLALAFMAASSGRSNLRLADVARAVHLSPWHLSRLLRECVGVGFARYMKETRLVHASTLLRSSSRSIKEISAEVGYKYARDFSRHFTARFGISPHEWRRRGHPSGPKGS
jgi:AraC-like DNA-binding protein